MRLPRSIGMNENRRRQRRYDKEFKRNALDLLELSSKTIAEVAADQGIPHKTLEGWRCQSDTSRR
jgi:transposase-like protein